MMRVFVFVMSVALALCVSQAHAAERGSPNPSDTASEPQRERHMVSWVVLSNSYVKLDEATLRAKLDEAFPGEFLPARDQGSFVVGGPADGAQFMIQSRAAGATGFFMLISAPVSYTRVSDFDKFITDATVRRNARAQRNWLSVDLIRKHGDATDDIAYRFIGRALAKLAPRDAAYLVHPTRRIVIAFDDEVRRRLETGELLP